MYIAGKQRGERSGAMRQLEMDLQTPPALTNVACGIIFLHLESALCAQASNLVFHGIDN